ncbi:peptidase inhibitor family I36 protein [Micromonospora cathayae]|uniref:Peptidase inhibitor family I36 protein n=1 Tax=Micromonospora cathayae TaxID=3028804 RepID=A0ABY7ZWP5_9ACTN|nr:peptidase inhibitor family I36 protein [Micromonospora sp. HUAS 3]WDZ86324.1 peptidase inhibitor family I36 protein [Micromonospora sp. HUAS 3]
MNFRSILASSAAAVALLAALPSPAQAAPDCDMDWVCVWTGTNYTGSKYQYSSVGYWQNFPGEVTVRSVYNKFLDRDAAVANGLNGGGAKYCIDSNNGNGNIQSKSLYIAYTNSNC